MIPQIPYREIGRGIAVLIGAWAFVVAETVRARALIAGIPVVVLLAGAFFPSRADRLIALIGWVIYGIGCILYLKRNGMEVR
jgi:hypothetical protein